MVQQNIATLNVTMDQIPTVKIFDGRGSLESNFNSEFPTQFLIREKDTKEIPSLSQIETKKRLF
jgi:hypothetical protein